MNVKIKTRYVKQINPVCTINPLGVHAEIDAEMSLIDMKETIMEMLKVIPGQQWDLWQQDFENEK